LKVLKSELIAARAGAAGLKATTTQIPDYIGVLPSRQASGLKKEKYSGRPRRLSSIMLKALADRLAEAFAGDAPASAGPVGLRAAEGLDHDALIAEKYTRHPRRLPACPDHSVKRDVFALLGAATSA
jgi:5-methyltetrahydrofolate--homocysteine methyltransferase